jgi:flagellar biosynthesis protein FlhG
MPEEGIPESALSIPPSLDLPSMGRRLIAVGGGKGGVGKSLIAQSIAVYLAQIGKRVVLVDADPTGANLHLSLGVTRTQKSLSAAFEAGDLEAALDSTSVPGLRLLVAPFDASSEGAVKGARKLRILQGLRTVAADDVVVDVGPGTSTAASDLFLAADIGVLVTVPEPAAVETSYRFVRATFVRDLRRALRNDRTRLRTFDRILGELPGLPMPVDLARLLRTRDAPIGDLAAQTLARMRPRLVVNQTRVRTDVELGGWMAQVAAKRLGVTIDPLGHIEHDDAVWLANRRRRPLLVDNPSSKAGRGLERIARRLVAVIPHRTRELDLPGSIPEAPNYYERLMIQRGGSEEEVRRAHKRQHEIYSADGLPTVSLFSEEELSREHALIDEAHDVLLDATRRRAYDVSVFADHAGGPEAPSPANRVLTEAMAAELVQLQSQVARELGPDTEFSGGLLRRIRESRGIDLKEIATRTKVGHVHLAAIEEESFDELPPLVYVRGFLVEIAKFLKLDPSQVARTYLRRAKDLLELRG